MSPIDFPPFVPFFFAAALLVPSLRGWARRVLLLVPMVGGLSLIGVEAGSSYRDLGSRLYPHPMRVDKLSLLFGYLFHLASFLAFLFAIHLKKEEGDTPAHGGTGVCRKRPGSGLRRGFHHPFHLLGDPGPQLGVPDLGQKERPIAGLGGPVSGRERGERRASPGRGLGPCPRDREHRVRIPWAGRAGILAHLPSFGIKAGFPLLHNWLVDAYPEATPTGTVFLGPSPPRWRYTPWPGPFPGRTC